MLNFNVLSTRLVLSFYTSLVRLLACCAPSNCQSQLTGLSCTNKRKQSTAERTRNILQNLVKCDEIVGILSLQFSADYVNGLTPWHKEAALLFLDRVYGIGCQELLLQLLTDAILPDIKTTLKLTQVKRTLKLHVDIAGLAGMFK